MTRQLAMLIIMLMSVDAVRCAGNFNILSYYRGNYLIPDTDKIQIGHLKQTTINTINESVTKKPILRTKSKLKSKKKLQEENYEESVTKKPILQTKTKSKSKKKLQEENYEKSQKFGRKKHRKSNGNSITENIDNIYSADTRDDKSYEKYDDQTFMNRKRARNGIDDTVNVKSDKNYEKNFDFKKRDGRKKGKESNGYRNMFHKDEHYQVHKFYDDDFDDEAFKRDGKVFNDKSDESNEEFN